MTYSSRYFYSSTFLWIAAFLCSLFLVNAWQLEWFGLAVVLAFSWAVVMLSQGVVDGWDVPKSWVLRFAGLFWLLAFFSVLLSEIPFVSITGFCFFSMMPLTFFVFVLHPDEKQFRLIGSVLAVIFAGLALWAMVQFFFLNEYFDGRAKHPLANPNSLAALFNLALFPVMGWMLAAKSRVQSNLALGLSVLIAGAIMMTGSRGSMFAAIPALAFFLYEGRGFLRQHWKCLSIVAVAAIVFFCLTTLGDKPQATMISRVADTVTAARGDVSNNRMNIWEGAWGIIKDHWFLGTGIGTFFLYYSEYRPPADITGSFLAHSDPLQYWAELGLVGIVLFYAFIVAVIVRTFRALKEVTDPVQRMLILAPFCGVGAVIIHTHVTFNLYNLSILFGTGFLLAVWFIATGKVLAGSVKKAVFPSVMPVYARAGLMAMPFALLGYLFCSFIISERFVNLAQKHLFAAELEPFAHDISRADTIAFSQNYRAYLLAVNVPLGVLQQPGGVLLPREEREALYGQAVGYLKRVLQINPRSSSALYYLAKTQQSVPKDFVPEGTPPPEEYYSRAIKIDPLHLGARMELAKIYEGREDLDKAVEIMSGGLDYKYRNPLALDFFGQAMLVYIQAGDKEKQQIAMRRMVAFKKRMDKSYKRQDTSLMEAMFGGEGSLRP